MRALSPSDTLPKSRSACKAVQAAIGMDAASTKLSDGDFPPTAVFFGQLGIASPSLQIQKAAHQIAGLERGGISPGRDHFASNVATRDKRKIGTQNEPQLALTNLPVNWIDARGANAHKNLIGVRSWVRKCNCSTPP
jgi:hypothetical protein